VRACAVTCLFALVSVVLAALAPAGLGPRAAAQTEEPARNDRTEVRKPEFSIDRREELAPFAGGGPAWSGEALAAPADRAQPAVFGLNAMLRVEHRFRLHLPNLETRRSGSTSGETADAVPTEFSSPQAAAPASTADRTVATPDIILWAGLIGLLSVLAYALVWLRDLVRGRLQGWDRIAVRAVPLTAGGLGLAAVAALASGHMAWGLVFATALMPLLAAGGLVLSLFTAQEDAWFARAHGAAVCLLFLVLSMGVSSVDPQRLAETFSVSTRMT